MIHYLLHFHNRYYYYCHFNNIRNKNKWIVKHRDILFEKLTQMVQLYVNNYAVQMNPFNNT